MIAKNSAKLNPKYRRKRTPGRTMADVAFDAQKLAFAPISFQAALALRDLGILNALNQAPATDKELARSTGLSLYAVQTLLENACALDLVQKNPQGLYDITKTGWFWLCDPMTRANADFVNDVCYLGMHSLQKSLKTGKPTGLKVFGKWKTVYEGLSKLPAKARKSWFAFDHFYSDIAFPEILPLVFARHPRHIMDIGANTGKWAKKCLQYAPDVQVTLVDLPGQLAVAKKNLKKVWRAGPFLAGQRAGQKIRSAHRGGCGADEPVFGLLFPRANNRNIKKSKKSGLCLYGYLYFGTLVGPAGICRRHVLFKSHFAVFHQYCQRQQQNVCL